MAARHARRCRYSRRRRGQRSPAALRRLNRASPLVRPLLILKHPAPSSGGVGGHSVEAAAAAATFLLNVVGLTARTRANVLSVPKGIGRPAWLVQRAHLRACRYALHDARGAVQLATPVGGPRLGVRVVRLRSSFGVSHPGVVRAQGRSRGARARVEIKELLEQ